MQINFNRYSKGKTVTDKLGAAAVKKTNPKNQRRVMVIFFAIFFIAGSAIGWFMFARPLLKIKASEDWSKKPCTIVSSRIKESRSDKSTTYKVDIVFKYSFNRVEYVSETYDFMSGSDSDYSSKRQVIRRYPPGRSTYCYVNPEEPSEAVISREFNSSWWFVLIPIIFMFIGAGGVIGTLIKKKKRKYIYSPDEEQYNGETVLKIKSSPLKNLIGITFFALVWNGIISIFIVEDVRSWQAGNIEWFLTLFMIPFVMVGIGTIVAFFYYFIALFNSKLVLVISNSRPQVGEKVILSWKIFNSANIDKLEIFLKAEESATYQSHGENENTHTRKSTFELLSVMDTTNKEAIHIGKTQFTIPRNTMHSFDAKNNKITWEIILHGEIKHFPDLKGEYPISVMPLNQESLHKILRSAENGDNNG